MADNLADKEDLEDLEEIPKQALFPESLDDATRRVPKRKHENKPEQRNNYHQKTWLFKRWRDTKI